jgi:DNA-binding MarR family transcriptional regulator
LLYAIALLIAPCPIAEQIEGYQVPNLAEKRKAPARKAAARKAVAKNAGVSGGRPPSAEPADQEYADVSMLESFVGYNLRRAAAKQRERFQSVFAPYDIRPAQLTVLAVIRHNMPLKQTALGKALEIKRANVVTLLDELEGRGLVTRRPADQDRRSHMLQLTPAGKDLTDRLLALHAKLESDLAESLGRKELVTLVELLQAFRRLESEPRLD